MMVIIVVIAVMIITVFVVLLQHPAFGALPDGARLERIKRSANYKDGAFANREETPIITSDTPILIQLWNQMFRQNPDLRPKKDGDIEIVKTDLKSLDMRKDQIVWLGHSSYLIVNGDVTILVDPVLTCDFPSNLFMRPFKGTDIYKPECLPDIDYLIITHDHWDHLDYGTVKQLKPRIGNVICPLGIGAHFAKWGFDEKKIHELDWDDSYEPQKHLRITCLTARHFSGRLLKRGGSLWASFMIEGSKTIFVGGDSGYGKHFAEIGRRFPHIDIAIVENGQYDEDWRYIHILPSQLPKAIHDLGAVSAMPVHNSKFALAKHSWNEPIKTAQTIAGRDTTFHMEIPVIGKPVVLRK